MTVKAAAHFVDSDIATGPGGTWQSLPAATIPGQFKATVVTDNTRFFILDDSYVVDTTVEPLRNDDVIGVGCQAVDIATNGNIVITLQPLSDGPAIRMYDSNGVDAGVDFEWDYGVESTLYFPSVTFSRDQKYIYATQGITNGSLFKWNVATGAQEWVVRGVGLQSTIMHPQYSDRVISFRNPWATLNFESWYPALYDEDGVMVDYWKIKFYTSIAQNSIPSRPSSLVANENNAYFGCDQEGTQFAIVRISLTNFDDFGTWTPGANATCFSLAIFGDFLYAFVADGSGVVTIYKFNADDLTVVTSVAIAGPPRIASFPKDMWIDWLGRIVLKTRTTSPSSNPDQVVLLDADDLSLLDTIDTTAGIWTPQLLYEARSLPSAVSHSFGPNTQTFSTSQQDRTVAYPEDWSHLEGEEVQVLGDGLFLGTEVVVGGEIALDDNTTVNHVGLKFISKVQPMKIDGEVNVKRIRKLIPQFNETVGGDYGRSLTELHSSVLRASGDPLDTTGSGFHTGHVDLPYDGTYDRSGNIWFTQDEPFPMQLLGIGVNLSKEAV